MRYRAELIGATLSVGPAEPHGTLVKLTVVHDGFEPDSTMISMISNGWPRVLSSLKTLLETGEDLAIDEPRPPAQLGLTKGSGEA